MQANEIKPTAATYVRCKWIESDRDEDTMSPQRAYLNNPYSFRGNYRPRYMKFKRAMRGMGKALAFLQFGKMSFDDKVRTIRTLWWQMENADMREAIGITVTHEDIFIYRNRFEWGAVVFPIAINDPEKLKAFYQRRRHVDVKFNDNIWSLAPWDDQSWFTSSPYAMTHFLHISEEDPLQVAYADSIDKFIADRFIRTKPGRYLTKYFGDVLDENQIRTWSERIQALAAPAELLFIASDDKEGWERVYRDGPQSCMKGDDSVQVYAHDKSVLRLAHLVHGNRIVARCIVREDTNEYIRVYPNTDTAENNRWHMNLRERLETAGYEHGDMEGVLLDCDEINSGEYVCPYIDGGNGNYVSASVVRRDGKRYLLLSRDGDMDAQSTSGTIGESCSCPCCGERCDEDDLQYVESRDESICQSCLDDAYVYAYVSRCNQEYIHNDDAIYCESNGEYYHTDYANDADIYQCEHTGNWYCLDDMCSTSRGYVLGRYCIPLDVEDSEGNSHAFRDDVTHTHDGRCIHDDDAQTREDGLVYHENDDQVETETETETEGE